MTFDYLVVGAGLTGATLARVLHDEGLRVLIVERRAEPGGNVHDHAHASGIRVHTYGPHYKLVAATVGISLVGVVAWGTISGSMLPFVLRRLGLDPASASAPLVATLVDVTGLIIYFTVAAIVLRGTLL